MRSDLEVVGRAQRVKQGHRRAIAEAAVALAEEFGPGGFTSEQLADRADVARRTVFNHYASIDAAIYAGLSLILDSAFDSIITNFEAGDGPHAGDVELTATFHSLCSAVLSADLVSPISRIVSTIPTREPNDPDTTLWAGGILRSLIPPLAAAAAIRAPQSRPSSRTLLVHSILAALTVTVEQWYVETNGVDDADSRSIWASTLESHLDRLRDGFGSTITHDHQD